MPQDKITQDKLEKYLHLTEQALEKAKKNISKTKEKQAGKILEIVEAYFSDSKYFKEKGDFVNSFACINYTHGWLDAGVRLGIFNVKDTKLFVVK